MSYIRDYDREKKVEEHERKITRDLYLSIIAYLLALGAFIWVIYSSVLDLH